MRDNGTFNAGDESPRQSQTPPRRPRVAVWIAVSIAASVGLHGLGMLISQQMGDWTLPNEPLHSFVETAGGAIGLAVAGLLLLLNRVGKGTSFNPPIAAGLGVMSVLDCLHALVPPGEAFVWLHSVATFAGGIAFGLVWLPRSARTRLVPHAAVASVCLMAGIVGWIAPDLAPRMVGDGAFTPAARFLNGGGGVLMLAAALRLTVAYARTKRLDDVLFAAHCLLFGGAAILFEWSRLWDFTWWWWHLLRLLAYAVALAFAVQSLHALAQATRRAKDQLAGAYDNAERRLETALRESRSLRLALDHNVLYSVTDTSGRIIDANAGFCEVSGYTREELLGETHRIVNSGVHPPEFWAQMWSTIKSGRTWRGEVCNRAKDGSLYWVDATNIPWRDAAGEVECYISLRIEVTERKQAADERDRLLEESAELARIIRESPSMVFVSDCETLRFVQVNHGACETTGYSAEELLRMTPMDLNAGRTEADCRRILAPIIEGSMTRIEFQAEHRRKDGSTYPAQVLLNTSMYKGRPVFVSFVNNLTEVKALESQLSRAQKLESIGQLAAGVAHEINTPMQFVGDNVEFLSSSSDTLFKVVDAYQELIETDDPESWPSRREQMRELIEECRFDRVREHFPGAIADSREGIQRVIKIVRAMKQFSHPGEVEKSSTNLNDLIDSTVSISRNRWKYVAEMDLRLDPYLPTAPMLASEINQVLLNLIVNAADAIADTRSNEEDPLGVIRVSTRADDDWVVVEIGDNGCGMTDEVKAKVFDPFYTTKDVGKGTGQGLAITQNVIVNQHGGEVDLETAPGVGTTFTVRLPREPEASTDADQATYVEPATA